MNRRLRLCVYLLALFLTGCLSSSVGTVGEYIDGDSWAVMPLINETDTIQADHSATALIDEHLRRRGANTVVLSSDNAASTNSNYVVTGRILDWQYEDLTRPKPKVKIALSVYDLATEELLWQEEQSRTGGSGDSIVAVANDVLASLVSDIDVSPSAAATPISNDDAISAAVTQLAAASQTPTAATAGVATAIRVSEQPVAPDSLPVANASVSQYAPGGSIALYYAANPPVEMLNEFDRVVLEPDAVTNIQLSEFNQSPDSMSTLFAYLSVGEVGPTRQWGSIDSAWNLGVNQAWNSRVMDLANPGWRAFLMRRADELLSRGFQGFFLDTMDSYQLFATTDEARQRQQQGLITFIASLKAKHPNIQLIANRGFEVLPSIAQYLDVIAAESLFARWHSGTYQAVPENDRAWLLGQLTNAQSRYGLEALSIDYVEPGKREDARQVAAAIAAKGIIPWVSTPALDQLGVGLEEVFPRDILLLFDSSNGRAIQYSLVHRLVAMPLEYQGYVPRYLDLAKEPLPAGNLAGRYAGVVSWNQAPITPVNWSDWLGLQKDNGVPVVLLGNFGDGTSPQLLQDMGLERTAYTPGRMKIFADENLVGFERPPNPRVDFLPSSFRSTSDEHEIILAYTDAKGVELAAVGITPWGGFGVTHGLIDSGPEEILNWIVDPFKFLKKALRLADLPQPDVTTQTGRRIVTSHIDGDALPSWAEMPGRRLGAQVLFEEIIKPGNYPHSISIVEAEMNALPQVADRRIRMTGLMRQMFREDNVQLATHTYSHPFKWDLLKEGMESGTYNLNIPGYQYSIEREIDGSIDFIERELAPPGKKVEVVFWSGNAIPDEAMLARVEELGLQNINGGSTIISESRPWLDLVSPMVRTVGNYEQIYAPIMNENVFTNDWTGPFDGFRHVVESFQLTEFPRRLKPISIYYHFYAGTKIASLRSMHEVYDWTYSQDIAPMFITGYTKRVGEFRRAQVSRSIDGWWQVSGLKQAQSIRWLNRAGSIDVASSTGVAGQRRLHDGLYIHPTSMGPAKFRLSETNQRVPELVSSNGQIKSWSRNGRSVSFHIEADVPVQLIMKNASGCTLSGPRGSLDGKQTQAGLEFTFTQKDTGNVSLRCPA